MNLTEQINRIKSIMGLSETLKENMQLADKVYFNTGKLSSEDRDFILKITNGDNYTKIISDFYFLLKENKFLISRNIKNDIRLLYNDVKTYNKNVFPISNYDPISVSNVYDTYQSFMYRRSIINNLKKLPSIAIRNLRKDIRKERNSNQLGQYNSVFGLFMGDYGLLDNKDQKSRESIERKMFKSDITIYDLRDFVKDKTNLLSDIDVSKKEIEDLSESEDFEIKYDNGNVMIVEVYSAEGIKSIGCTSLWCFTYGRGFALANMAWDEFSHNNMVYVIIDFREKTNSPEFMHVLIGPLINYEGKFINFGKEFQKIPNPLYNMVNENYFNPYDALKHLFGEDYEKIVREYLNFE